MRVVNRCASSSCRCATLASLLLSTSLLRWSRASSITAVMLGSILQSVESHEDTRQFQFFFTAQYLKTNYVNYELYTLNIAWHRMNIQWRPRLITISYNWRQIERAICEAGGFPTTLHVMVGIPATRNQVQNYCVGVHTHHNTITGESNNYCFCGVNTF